MKKMLIYVLLLTLAGCSTTDKPEETHSYVNITSGNELVGAYRDGEDIMEEQKALREQMEENISRYLNRDKEELEFERFCILAEEGMTVEVEVDGVEYTFTCDVEGNIVRVGKNEGKGDKIRKNNFQVIVIDA